MAIHQKCRYPGMWSGGRHSFSVFGPILSDDTEREKRKQTDSDHEDKFDMFPVHFRTLPM
jgi:hypothetical protein